MIAENLTIAIIFYKKFQATCTSSSYALNTHMRAHKPLRCFVHQRHHVYRLTKVQREREIERLTADTWSINLCSLTLFTETFVHCQHKLGQVAIKSKSAVLITFISETFETFGFRLCALQLCMHAHPHMKTYTYFAWVKCLDSVLSFCQLCHYSSPCVCEERADQ